VYDSKLLSYFVLQEKINAKYVLFLFGKALGPQGYFLVCKTNNLG
jgi:hypothetical protein